MCKDVQMSEVYHELQKHPAYCVEPVGIGMPLHIRSCQLIGVCVDRSIVTDYLLWSLGRVYIWYMHLLHMSVKVR